jgi:hypothetical protein
VARRWLVIAALLGLLTGLTTQAGAQASPPPCTDLGPQPPSISADDIDGDINTNDLIATHTIIVRLDEGTAPIPTPDDNAIQWSLPAGVTQSTVKGERRRLLDLGPTRLALFVDNPGTYPISASWAGDNGGAGLCTVTVTFTLQLQPATPFRLSNPNRRHKVETLPGWDWRVLFGPRSDRRPIQIMYRSVTRRQFPTGPFKTYTAAVRAGDPGYNEGDQRTVKLHRWLLNVEADNTKFELQGEVRSHGIHQKPLGYEVKIIQGGRQLGDLRVAARCGVFDCRNSRVKLQR